MYWALSDKPIYDIAGIPECTGEELTKNLLDQIKLSNFRLREFKRLRMMVTIGL